MCNNERKSEEGMKNVTAIKENKIQPEIKI